MAAIPAVRTAGIAATPLLAGALTAVFGWRYAFIVPGAVILVTGIAFLFVVKSILSTGVTATGSGDPIIERSHAVRGQHGIVR